MKCFGKHNSSDRICQLCEVANLDENLGCILKTIADQDMKEFLNNKKQKCGYRKTCYEDYESFFGCTKNKSTSSRYTDSCDPTLTCHEKECHG